jgi:uncharacterized protein
VPTCIDLTKPQLSVLKAVFVPLADKIDEVGVFGSRAVGKARPGSDVDLVIYGALTEQDISQLRQDLDESDLSIFADIVGYEGVKHTALREQIDKTVQPLFNHAELMN